MPALFLRAGEADDTAAAWMAIAAKRPQATIGLLSALALHELTDAIPTRTDVAIPRGINPIEPWTAPVTWHRFDAETYEIGRGEPSLRVGLSIGLYSAERTIIDVFRLRLDWGIDLAIEALKPWPRKRGSSPSSLICYGGIVPEVPPCDSACTGDAAVRPHPSTARSTRTRSSRSAASHGQAVATCRNGTCSRRSS